jgi:hypothetical protein
VAFGRSPRDRQGPVVAAPSRTTAAESPTVETTTALPVVPTVPTASPTVVPPSATPTPAASPSPSPRPALRVYNYSRRQGLARRAAAEFRNGGWVVVEVANTSVRTAITTVYVSPGQEAAAAELRRQFPDIRDTRPKPAGLPEDELVVVVTKEYPA